MKNTGSSPATPRAAAAPSAPPPAPPPVGIIAGMGQLPRIIAADAMAAGRRVVAVTLEPLPEQLPDTAADVVVRVNVGRLGAIIKAFTKEGVSEVILAGKVPKTILYNNLMSIRPDMRTLSMLMKLGDRKDDSILTAITKELEKEGIRILDTTEFSPGLITPEGVLTKRKPTRGEYKDIEFGWRTARELGKLDVGQTVVVKDMAVMALEAIEGTDEAILRGGRLAHKGAVVVKVSKPGQDMRFDVPTAGMETIKAMAESRASVLAIEAGRSILVDRERLIEAAAEHGIAVVGHKG